MLGKASVELIEKLVIAHKRAVQLASRTTQDAVLKLGDIVAAAAQVGAPCGVTWTLHP